MSDTPKRPHADSVDEDAESRCYKFVRHNDIIVTCDCCKVRKDGKVTEMCIDCALHPECQVGRCDESSINVCESCAKEIDEQQWFVCCKNHSENDMPRFDDNDPCEQCCEYNPAYKPCDLCGETRAADFHGCTECMFCTDCFRLDCNTDIFLCHGCKEGFEATECVLVCKECTPSNQAIARDRSWFKHDSCACCEDWLPIAPNDFWRKAFQFLSQKETCERCGEDYYLCNQNRCHDDRQPNFQHCSSDDEESD